VNAKSKGDVVFPVPLERIDHDVVRIAFPGEDRRQHDAVVVDRRFVAEDGDLEHRSISKDLLDARHARHAVTDDHKAFHR
jgi:hypothetical protein